MLTMNRAVLRAVTFAGLVAGAVVAAAWTAGPALATQRRLALDARLWVGSSPLTQVAGLVREDALLGVNFGVTISGADAPTDDTILVSLNLEAVSDMVVVAGLTSDCAYTPLLITCAIKASDLNTHLQSMTLKAASGAPVDTWRAIAVSASWADDADIANNTAVIDLCVVAPPPPSPQPAASTPAAPLAASATASPIVIAALPNLPGAVAGTTLTPAPPGFTPRPAPPFVAGQSANPRPKRTLASSSPHPGADPTTQVDVASAALGEPAWKSQLVTASFLAAAAALLAAATFAAANLRRDRRPRRR